MYLMSFIGERLPKARCQVNEGQVVNTDKDNANDSVDSLSKSKVADTIVQLISTEVEPKASIKEPSSDLSTVEDVKHKNIETADNR